MGSSQTEYIWDTRVYGMFSLEQLANLYNILGIEVKNLSNGSLLLSQTKCILDLLTEVDMACAKCISIPIVGGWKFNKFGNG